MKNAAITLSITIILITLLIACTDNEKDPITSQPPVFSATPVDLSGPYDPTDSTFGDIKMVEPVITPFGASLDQFRRSPAIEYFTRLDAPVFAVTRGLVEHIVSNQPEQNDYEIWVTSLPGSDYKVIYDHVVDLFVLENVIVEAGDTLGRTGIWTENADRTELQVNFGVGSNERSYCPLNFGDSAFIEAHQNLVDEYDRLELTPRIDSLCLVETVIP